MRVRKRLTPTKKQARSRLTNGRYLLENVDGRSGPARRYRDLYEHYLQQTGGQHDELCRQAASLILRRELLDAAAVRGELPDPLLLVRLCGAINRTLARLNAASVNKDAESERQREREDREAGLIA